MSDAKESKHKYRVQITTQSHKEVGTGRPINRLIAEYYFSEVAISKLRYFLSNLIEEDYINGSINDNQQ